ncbi:hypothetical protein I204_02527 [Kwoniella mangroviensis CBS 8886]|nr:hypothetical protein I204_02527 [Kwoniella mangroviensis CBS 8886]
MNVLSTLRNGMSALRAQVQPRIDNILTQRSSGFLISQADDDWLDFEANLTNELHVLESVEASANDSTTLESRRANIFAAAIDRLLAAGSIDINSPDPLTTATSPAVLSSPSSILVSIEDDNNVPLDGTLSIPSKKIRKVTTIDSSPNLSDWIS